VSDLTTSPAASIPAYGLAMPTCRDVRDSLERIYGPSGAAVWERLVRESGIDGHEQGPEALRRLLVAMEANDDPVVALCGTSMAIRLTSFDHLSAAHAAIRRSQQ
jgi:hypothetical protein